MKNKFKKNEKGFALPFALLLMVVMAIMGATLVTVISNEHNANNNKDTNQQTFYAAESGIAVAKKWMVDNMPALAGNPTNNLNSKIRFCKATFFPNLINSDNGFHTDRKSLIDVITSATTDEEKKRLSNYSFEYFIAYSPKENGDNSRAQTKSGSNSVILYTIYSCGCNKAKNNCNSSDTIVSLEAVVTLVN
jgi:Tfp pilus assembly protein PilX